MFVLREDQLSVQLHIEDATAAFDEFGLDSLGFLDRSHQTGGLGEVVSTDAVFNGQLHEALSLSMEWSLPALLPV